MREEYRWLLTAKLTTLTALRIGDGGVLERRVDRHPDAEVASVFAMHYEDGSKTPYIPGTSVKGWLRNYAEEVLPQNEVLAIFGGQEGGGCLRVFDGRCKSQPSDARISEEGIDWDPNRRTCVSANAVIDRLTGAASHKLLFHEEFVPAGSAFTLEFELRPREDEHAFRFLWLLEQFRDERGGPQPLGGGTAFDWGRVVLGDFDLKGTGRTEMRKWLKSDTNQPPTTIKRNGLQGRGPSEVKPASTIEVEVILHFEGAFITNDPSRERRRGDPSGDEGNLTPRRLQGWKPYLPESSLHGALRSQMEKILRTMEKPAAMPTSDRQGGIPVVRDRETASKMDLASLWFGAPGWRSPMRITGQIVRNPGRPEGELQEMVSIDRFTGGGAEHRKFQARYFWKPVLQMTLVIDRRGLEWALGNDLARMREAWRMLSMVLRDLAEGWITLGAGASKGWGRCTAQTRVTSGSEWIREFVGDKHAKLAWERGSRAPLAITPTQGDQLPTKEAGAGSFFNPYHFCKLKKGAWADAPTLADLRKPESKLTLDRYHDGLVNGYLDCELTVETPLFVGGKQQQQRGDATKAEHYTRDGAVAIPATTLRGLISAQLEVLSNSAMRVLDNSWYSARKSTDEALSAIGMMVRRKGGWYLKPMCLPTFGTARPLDPMWKEVFAGAPVLKKYVARGKGTWKNGDLLARENVPPLRWANDRVGVLPATSVLTKQWAHIAYSRTADGEPVSGVYRSLDIDGHDRQKPPDKHYELFLPTPFLSDGFLEQENAEAEDGLLRVPDSVVDTFERVAKQLSRQWKPKDGDNVRPYEPWGTRPERYTDRAGPRDRDLQIRSGDMVYFDWAREGERRVTEISFSAIWRAAVQKPLFSFVQEIDQDLLPMSPERMGGRALEQIPITLAEKLFGFVEMREEEATGAEAQKEQPLQALRGRVRFTDATLVARDPNVQMGECKLKILSSPKPPCPSMYFFREGEQTPTGQYIAKTRLGAESTHRIRGRKFYLHQEVREEERRCAESPWQSRIDNGAHTTAGQYRDDDQKLRVQPVAVGTKFRFRILFENLTREELAWLRCALRPHEDVRYKLGLGKPLGLGTVRLDPSKEAAIANVSERYGEDGLQRPSEALWNEEEIGACTVDLSTEYLALHAHRYRGVAYPHVDGQHELLLYKWFVRNDKDRRTALPEITDGTVGAFPADG